ncbi:MAG: YfhO family protein [Bacteroidales bacterium]|jgi:hypothetical protein|nr:YfhO family protein [Bacteroidales bacterium]MDN5350690.1 hypothetical protein [Bacteroidales bacterium]
MKNNNPARTKFLIAIITAILSFLVITIAYFNPLLEGKRLEQHDIAMWKGMSKEIVDFRKETGEEPLWTNSMFGGMPAWQISVIYGNNLMRYVKKVVQLWLPYPANAVFVYMLGFFVLLLVMRVNPWLSMAGAIAFAFSSYFLIILGAGHTSKAYAIGYMAPVLAGIVLAYRGKYLWGALLASLALALQLEAGHLQITYYLLLIVVILGIIQLIDAVRFKTMPNFFKASGFLIVGALLAVLTHSTNLYATYDYGKESMRGKPVLTKNADDQTRGLDRSYITNWSYGIGETWSLLIPNAKGGATAMLGSNHPALEKADRGMRQALAQQNAYWGDQPGTSGPVYVGAIVVFLFVLGVFFVKGKYKWILLSATVLSIVLSWGKNFMPFTDFFLDYIPGYNKFRAVSMTLVIAELTIPLLGFLGLYQLYQNPEILRRKQKYFWISFGLTGGLAFLFYLMPTTFFNFFSQFELEQFNRIKESNPGNASQIDLFLSQLEAVRVSIFKADALRSFIFILLATAVLYFYSLKKIKASWLIAAFILLILFDMVPVAQRYLNNDNFVPKRKVENPFQLTQADKEILKDNDPNFRVLDLTKNIFNDASTSYYHHAIGGYHGAKLQRYQDLIDHYLQAEIQAVSSVFNENPNMQSINAVLAKQQVLNMLNTRYFIYSPTSAPLRNTFAFGNAWFAENIVWVQTPNEEIDALEAVNLRETAVLHNEFREMLNDFDSQIDSSATIKLTQYAPNKLNYELRSVHNQLVVFSEIWTTKGWNLYVDGQKHDLLRANYILRAALIPAGNHQLEMRYEPRVWAVGEKVSLASSLLLILLAVGIFINFLVKQKKAEA